MDLITVQNVSGTLISCGDWKPLFKARARSEDYHGEDRDKYEKELLERVLGDKEMKITENDYPFTFGPEVQQWVIWMREEIDVMGIYQKVVKENPGCDVIVSVNKPEYRSIKTINHCHALIKPRSIPSKLLKLTIYHRHAHRSPIVSIPKLGRIINKGSIINKGLEASLQFGKDLANIYDLKHLTLTAYSSPVNRCHETLDKIMEGLGKRAFMNINTDLIIMPDCIPTLEGHDSLVNECQEVLNKIEEVLGKIDMWNGLFETVLCLRTELTAYCDMGVNVREMLGDLYEELERVSTVVMNLVCKDYIDNNPYLVSRLLPFSKEGLTICATHDITLFPFVKYFSSKYNYPIDLEFPEYLSNLRIEQWTDGVERIYYNNRLFVG